MKIERAIIIGAGIGGLATALALRQQGTEVTVYEQAENLALVGAGLTLWCNAIRGLRILGVADEVIKNGARIAVGELRSDTGQVLGASRPGEFEALYGEPTIAIHRASLHQCLLAQLPAELLKLNHKCRSFQEENNRVTVRFENGASDEAELLIGADGINSVIRRQLFPHLQLRYSGYSAWRGVATVSKEAMVGTTSESLGRGSRFGIVPISHDRIYWFCTANMPANKEQAPAERKEFLRARYRGWHAPIEALIDATEATAILHNDIYDMLPTDSWGRGRVMLLGDAIHPTTPNLGQGACMAIESSVVLTRCLAQSADLAQALQRYQAERIPRTSWITNQSWNIGRIGQLENSVACALRNLLYRFTPESVIKKTLQQAVGYKV